MTSAWRPVDAYHPPLTAPPERLDMNKTSILGLLLASAIAAATAQTPSAEELLSDLELRTAKFIAGKEKMLNGFAQLPAHLRQVGCKAYPVKTDAETIAIFKDRIATLESPENAGKLDAAQTERLAQQKDMVAKFSPGVDCTKLQ